MTRREGMSRPVEDLAEMGEPVEHGRLAADRLADDRPVVVQIMPRSVKASLGLFAGKLLMIGGLVIALGIAAQAGKQVDKPKAGQAERSNHKQETRHHRARHHVVKPERVKWTPRVVEELRAVEGLPIDLVYVPGVSHEPECRDQGKSNLPGAFVVATLSK